MGSCFEIPPIDSWSESEVSDIDLVYNPQSASETPDNLNSKSPLKFDRYVKRVDTWENGYEAFKEHNNSELKPGVRSQPAPRLERSRDYLHYGRKQPVKPTPAGLIRNVPVSMDQSEGDSQIYYAPGMPRKAENTKHSSSGVAPFAPVSSKSPRTSLCRRGNPRRQEKTNSGPIWPVTPSRKRSFPPLVLETDLHIPPVFTWPIEDNPEVNDESMLDRLGNFEHQSNGKNFISAEVNKNGMEDEKKTLGDVTHDIHQELSRPPHSKLFHDPILYAGSVSASLEQVEIVTKGLFGLSLSEMIMPSTDPFSKMDTSWRSRLKKMARLLLRLFNFFIPLTFSCEVANKYWGAYCSMMHVSSRLSFLL